MAGYCQQCGKLGLENVCGCGWVEGTPIDKERLDRTVRFSDLLCGRQEKVGEVNCMDGGVYTKWIHRMEPKLKPNGKYDLLLLPDGKYNIILVESI